MFSFLPQSISKSFVQLSVFFIEYGNRAETVSLFRRWGSANKINKKRRTISRDEARLKNQEVYVAVLTSVFINMVLGLVTIIADAQHPQKHLRLASSFDTLAFPSNSITEWFVPMGHGRGHLLLGAVVSITISVIQFALLIWIALAVYSQVREI